MNWKQLSKMQHKRIKPRPMARRFQQDGKELERLDDIWLIQGISRDSLTLRNTRTEHLVPIGSDHIREFLTDKSGQSDGFLRLKSEIIIQGREVSLEPLDDRGASMRPQRAGISLDEIDEALRLAAGIVIQGPSPISVGEIGNYATVWVSSFLAFFRSENIEVAYNSGSLAGLAPETTYYIYFEDPTRSGGAVPYIPTPVRHQAFTGRKIYLGRVRIPSARP
jgi:hypothetical protein